MASREIFWNIQFGEIVYLLAFIVIVVAAYAMYRRVRLWRLGSKDDRLSNLPNRVWTVLVKTMADGLWHRRIVRARYAGIMHLLIFGGFALLLIGPLLDFTSDHFVHFYVSNQPMSDIDHHIAYANYGYSTTDGKLLLTEWRQVVVMIDNILCVVDPAQILPR